MKRAVLMLLSIVLLANLFACGEKNLTWQEQYDLGVRYLEEGNYEEAIIAFTAAIEIDPKQAPAYVGRGDAYIAFDETKENLAAAQADYEMAIELDAVYTDAYLKLAEIYFRQEDYEKATEVLQRGLEETGSKSISDKLIELEESLEQQSAHRNADDVTENNVSYFENCTYEYQGKQVIITYADDHVTASITYLMKNERNHIYAFAVLGIAAMEAADRGSGLFVDSWSIVEVDPIGNYVAGSTYDGNGVEIGE